MGSFGSFIIKELKCVKKEEFTILSNISIDDIDILNFFRIVNCLRFI